MNQTGNLRYSLKKFFTFWFPIIFLLSTIISIGYIFSVEEVAYLGSSFNVATGNFWGNILSVFFSAAGASNGLIITVLVCSLVLFLIVEIFSIIRLFKLRKIEQSGSPKMLLRFLAAQVMGVGVFFVSIILILAISLGVAFVYGYGDLKINTKEALNGTISDDQEIIKNIQQSPSVIDIYDASDEAGAVLAKRDLKKKDKLTTYEGTVLPLLVKFKRRDPEGTSFFVPSTNSVVYTNFIKDRTDKIIIELALNRLKYHPNPIAVSSFEKNQKPPVAYLDDQAYAPFRKKKLGEINDKVLSDFKAVISANQRIVSECVKLIAEQESDYRKNCIVEVNYSNCPDVIQQINENKSTCQENKAVLASQYRELEELKADIEKKASSVLTEHEGELSSGSYDPNTRSIYMRVIPGQDSFRYLSTLLHELFHHYSNGGSELPSFINEGTTEYATYKSFKLSDYEIADVSGYFKEVQVVMALLEKIPEQEIMTAYFNDNAKMFEASFKKAFPGVDYKKFLSKGDTMYKETYEEIGPTFNLGFWDTQIDHPAVQDMRIFLELEPKKFNQ
ncbi:MAG: hypothetical protein Q7R61_00755 [bacterium]|nr:hypothetical protein [bacterium]